MAKNIDKTLFTEEGMTRLRNFNRRAATYFALWIIVAIVTGGGLFFAQVRYGLKPLQRIYLKQYVIASVKTIFSDKRQSRYTFLVRTDVDLSAKKPVPKEAFIRVTDTEVEPVLDENGRVVRDPKSGLQFKLNPGISAKYFFWRPGRGRDIEMWTWMRANIYEGRSLLGMSTFRCPYRGPAARRSTSQRYRDLA